MALALISSFLTEGCGGPTGPFSAAIPGKRGRTIHLAGGFAAWVDADSSRLGGG
jgi:hypothetical protein